ncbi:lipoprotein LpqV [Mycobacterium sp. NPDC051804]|uniref:lipoprotein LpqV n=1 Tax=Mycobacterium sp. NPDC051804 TaxID=3364295 RepID=UPI00378A707B
MRRYTRRAANAVTLVIVGTTVATGCSSGNDGEPATSAPETTATTASEPSETPTAAPGEVAVSPGGVTTAIGAPADSTEDEYFQACLAAREWMGRQGGDPKSQLEPYLKSVQSADAAPGPGTFGTPWSALPPERQAAVIVAAQAAADALCG